MPSASSQKPIPIPRCVISAQTLSSAQSRMYQDDPTVHNHLRQQPLQYYRPREVATTIWPHQTTNYWFPNWRELFHGFTVAEGGAQPRQATASSFEQTWGVERAPQYARSSHSPSYGAQTTDPPQSSHRCAAALAHHQQQLNPPLTSPVRHPPASIILTHEQQVASSWVSSGPCLAQPCPDLTAQTPPPPPAQLSSALPLLDKIDRVQNQDAIVACPPSRKAAGPISKSNLKAPFWLPQGWVTEFRMRRTRTAADKLYRHLASGRRFRSRSDVLHFISTGKGRSRKKGKRSKSLPIATGHSVITNTSASQKSSASKLFPHSLPPILSSEERHSNHVAITPMLMEPNSEPRTDPGIGPPPSKQSLFFSAIQGTDSSLHQWKRPAQQNPQKLPVKKKAKAVPDNQSSLLWQGFNHSGLPANEELPTPYLKPQGVEKQTTEMTDLKDSSALGLKDATSQRTVRLGREIEAAHNTVVQMSKEMQATVEKLSREILEAQKDMRSCTDQKLLGAPAEKQVGSINATETAEKCREIEVIPWSCTDQVHRRTDNPSQQAKWHPPPAVDCVSHGMQGGRRHEASTQATNSMPNDVIVDRRNPSTSHVLTQPSSSISNVTRPAIWPNLPFHQGIPLEKVTCASEAVKRHLVSSSCASKLAENASAATVISIQEAPSTMAAQIYVQPSAGGKETAVGVTRPAMWPGILTLNVAQPTETYSINKDRTTKAAPSCGILAYQAPEQPANAAHGALSIRTPSPGARNVVMVGSQSTQPAPVGGVAQANVAQAAQRQTPVECDFLPAMEGSARLTGSTNAPAHNPAITGNVIPVHAGGGPFTPLNAAQTSESSETGSGEEGDQEERGRQRCQDRRARRLRRKKFAAVLNPRLDLSRLNPALTARQRAKAVQRMKSRHARQLLAALGLHLCRRAVRGSIAWTR